jgi:hypothetical protein
MSPDEQTTIPDLNPWGNRMTIRSDCDTSTESYSFHLTGTTKKATIEKKKNK